MSLNDSGAIILIVGALAVLAFVINGLWFSGKSSNRRLNKSSQTDQQIAKSKGVGKVRIVVPGPEARDGFAVEDSSVPAPQESKEPQDTARTESVSVTSESAHAGSALQDSYEINVHAPADKPFSGENIDELFKEWGFMRTPNKIYVCTESLDEDLSRAKVVFKICSLDKPFIFPDNMAGFTTGALAIYMNLPERGKAEGYYTSMRRAAEEIVDRLGGEIRDNDDSPLSENKMDGIALSLREYDERQDESDAGANL